MKSVIDKFCIKNNCESSDYLFIFINKRINFDITVGENGLLNSSRLIAKYVKDLEFA